MPCSARMLSQGFALASAPSRVIVGPVCTCFGFRYWYLACFQDAIIAVPQSFLAGVAFSYSNDSRPVAFGALSQLLTDVITGPGRRLREQRPTLLERMPDSQLRSKPNVAIPISQLRSLSFKASKIARAGLIVTPDIIIEMNTGKKQIYGVLAQNFDKAHAQFLRMYPQLCKQ